MPRAAPYTSPKEDGPVTLAAIKQIVKTSEQNLLEQLSGRMKALEDRADRVDEMTANQNKTISELQATVSDLHRKVTTLEESEEKARRHSYSFDLLLHGIAENDTADWQSVVTFLTNSNLQHQLPALEGTAFRLGRPPNNQQDPNTRPRPILFRLVNRMARTALLSAAGKKNVAPAMPYISSHLTRGQLEQLREKATKAIQVQGPRSMDQ